MKHFYFFAVVLLTAFSSNATVLTVDNNISSPGQYTSLPAAVTAAAPGDSIYISGSNTSYGAVTITKRLTIFGTGYNPSKQIPLVSSVGAITLDSVISVSGASGTRIYGIAVTSGNLDDTYGAKNVTIERVYFNGTYISLDANSSGFIIRHNVFSNSSIYLYQATNTLIENNLMFNSVVYYSAQPTVIINHNVFMSPVASGYYALYQISYAAITNNIFWATTPLGTSTSVVNNTFNNNLTFQTTNDLIPGPSNLGSANLVSTNPQFVNVPSPGINFSYDYNVSNASAANNAGTEGTDLGVFGGINPMLNLNGMPAIPQMIQMNIANPVVAPGGNLNVTFKAKKNN